MQEQRKVVRRRSDELFREISQKSPEAPLDDKAFLRVVLLICELSVRFGKRQEDRLFWMTFLKNLEKVVDHFRELWILGRMPGLVRLRKERGKKTENLPSSVMEGWEIKQPIIGESYVLFLRSGKLLQTSVVKEIDDNRINTKNSTYAIEVLEEYVDLSDFIESFINSPLTRTKHQKTNSSPKNSSKEHILKVIK